MAKKKKKKTSPQKRKTKQNAQKTSILGFLVKWVFVLGLWGSIALTGVLAWYGHDLPELTKDTSFKRKSAIIVKGADGKIIGRYGDIVGKETTIKDLPQDLINAVLATEDRRFYHHFGIDPIGLARAMYVNSKSGKVVQGGSTITQQLAKNMFLSRERTLERKIQEAMLAIWLEIQLTKDEILSTYLNRVYMGGGTYGVDGASRLYFNKPVQDIDLRESATLAGLLKAPSRYSPISNPGLSRQRTQTVLTAMADAGYISEDQLTSKNGGLPRPDRKPGSEQSSEKYYADWIVDRIDAVIGAVDEDIIVETTYDSHVQMVAENALEAVINENVDTRHISQGAVVVMRPTGEVIAMVGGYDYGNSQFNRATQALRQPGSSFKPFVYLTALEYGLTPETLIFDEPITTGRYRPKNFGHKYYGKVTLSDALMLSLNTVAFQLISTVTPQSVVDTAKRLGIKSPLHSDPSLALGTSEVTPLEITGAYTTIANGGYQIDPYGIVKITNSNGELYYERPENKYKERVIDPYDASQLSLMMRRVITDGTGRGASIGVPAAGKTGTSQDSRDAWFIGFTNNLITGVWLGNDDNSSMKHVTGGSFPASIWRTVMSQSNNRYTPVYINNYNGLSGFDSLLDRILTPQEGNSWFNFGNDGNGFFFRRGEHNNDHRRERYAPKAVDEDPNREQHEQEGRYN